MKLNKDYFKRESTWMNIAEIVVATSVQLSVGFPSDLSIPVWCYIGLRMLMAIIQGVKRDISEN